MVFSNKALGSPPTPYNTNDSESINAAIKEKVNYRKSEWPQFNAKMKKLVNSLVQEAEKAIIGFGEFRIRDEYKHLVVPVEKWNQMTKEQRKRAICKFHSAGVHEVRISSTTSQPPRHDNPLVVSTPATTASSSAPTSQSLLCLMKT